MHNIELCWHAVLPLFILWVRDTRKEYRMSRTRAKVEREMGAMKKTTMEAMDNCIIPRNGAVASFYENFILFAEKNIILLFVSRLLAKKSVVSYNADKGDA